MTYQPKVGDRVRATRVVEGAVTANVDGEYSYVLINTDDGDEELHDDDRWSFEKLADPEPKWVNGDVVRRTYAEELEPIARIQGAWRTVNHGLPLADRELSRSWDHGDVEILYKADAERVEAA
jgi:hypothetical protein